MKIKDNPRLAAARAAVARAKLELQRAIYEAEREEVKAARAKREASRERATAIAAYVRAGNTMADAGREFEISGTRVKHILQAVERRARTRGQSVYNDAKPLEIKVFNLP